MKNKSIALEILLILILLALPTKATIIFNDGGVHEISSFLDTYIMVENSFWDEPTTVNLVDDFLLGICTHTTTV